jgi:hypothetical protein
VVNVARVSGPAANDGLATTIEEGHMPTRILRPPRRSKRLRALLSACVVAGACAAAVPSSAGAYTEHFCQYAWMGSGADCYAGSRHTLQAVNGWSINTWQRVCAASFVAPWGSQNTDWRCDYGSVQKWIGGRVDGVGGIHNGDPSPFYGYGTQDF